MYFVEQLYDLQLQRDIDWEHSSQLTLLTREKETGQTEQRQQQWEQGGHSSIDEQGLHTGGCWSASGMRSGKGGSWELSDFSSGSSLTERNSSSEMWWTERILGSWLSMTGK